jgi:uncharacterized protein (DUF302 family)
METAMLTRFTTLVLPATFAAALAVPGAIAFAGETTTYVGEDGIVVTPSAYPMAETIDRLKADIETKGIVFFMEIDQQDLAAGAGIDLHPSTLLIFGNPALGSHFITARAEAGLDWPVRLLVHEDEEGQVWTAYTDFSWIDRRHGITDREAEFAMASEVIGSIVSSVAAE